MWFVFEAEYVTENGRANWNKPVPETMVWHGPYESGPGWMRGGPRSKRVAWSERCGLSSKPSM